MRPMPPFVPTHVDYVTDPEASPDPLGFLLGALGRVDTLLMLGIGAIVVVAVLVGWARWRPLEDARVRFVGRAADYRPYVPWMIRLSVGLVLIGAGLSRVLFMPTLPAAGWVSILLTACGFLLLLGFAVRAAAIVGLAIYAVSFLLRPELVMIFDVAGALTVAAILGPGAPSLDDLLRAAFPRGPGARVATGSPESARYDDLVPLLVRLGLGGAFMASGIIDKFLIYEQALAAVDKYSLTSVVPVAPELWVVGAGLVETLLGVAVLLGAFTRLSAIVAFTVLTLALFGLPDDPVIAHVGLFGLCSILVVLGGGRWSLDHALLHPIGERVHRG